MRESMLTYVLVSILLASLWYASVAEFVECARVHAVWYCL